MTARALLQTKLHPPTTSGRRVSRPRLHTLLERGLDGPLILVSAGAGCGKSTLIVDWLEQSKARSAWISLDEGDNDPGRFLSYFVGALKQLGFEPEVEVETALLAPQAPDPRWVLAELINTLNHRDPSERTVLVLDDFHLITNEHIHEGLRLLIDHLPATLRVLIATRVDPPWPLARLRVRGRLLEVRAEDLGFTPKETEVFFRHTMQIELDKREISRLAARTEGWIAGLQLAALSLRGRTTEATKFIDGFAGNHRFVLDYLTEEVLANLSAEELSFLLSTSILERLSGPLCDAVLERDDSQSWLERLDSANLFLIPLDDERRWYRYHHLFVELLRQQLERRTETKALIGLHQRASDWLAKHDELEGGLRHAIAARDSDRAIALILHHAPGLFMTGDARTLLSLTGSLPEAWFDEHPSTLGLTHVWALLMDLRPQEGEVWLDRLEPRLQGMPVFDVQIAGLRGHLARSFGDMSAARELYHRVLEDDRDESLFVRGTTSFDLGSIYLSSDDLQTAMGCFEKSLRLNRAAGHQLLAAWTLYYLAETTAACGDLRSARALCDQAIVEFAGQDMDTVLAMPYAGLAGLHREWDQLEEAHEAARLALHCARLGGLPAILLSAYLVTVRVACSRAAFAEAHDGLEELDKISRQVRLPGIDNLVMGHRALVLLRALQSEGEAVHLDRVEVWVREVDLLARRDDPRQNLLPGEYRDFAHLAQVRFLLLQGESDRALEVLGFLSAVARQAGRVRSLIEIRLLEALAYHQQEERELARMTLTRALQRAESGGFVRLIIEAGVGIGELLDDLAVHDPDLLPDYVARLRQAWAVDQASLRQVTSNSPPLKPAPGDQKPATEPPSWIEPISDREREVLLVVATGASNQEAARRLCISPATVKKHLENIYSKLGVHNRMEAVQRSRELGQLSLE